MQYATQTVTVTDRDAKALGQPVGSTTTVLLTAYPGGASTAGSGGGGGGGTEQQPTNPTSDAAAGTIAAVSAAATQQFLTTTQPTSVAAPGNVQVVYSASHVDPMPDSMASSNPTNPDLAADFTSAPPPPSTQIAPEMGPSGATMGHGGLATSQADGSAVSMGVSDYLNPASSREMMMPHAANSNVGGANEADTANDLAAELIREYSLGTEGLERKANPLAQMAESAESKGNKSPES